MRDALLEAIYIKMEQIEKRLPLTYQNNAKWIALNEKQKEIALNKVKQELEYQEQRLKKMGKKEAYDSISKIKGYKQYIENCGDKTKNERVKRTNKK